MGTCWEKRWPHWKKNKPLTHFAKWIEIIFGWALVEVSCFYEHNSARIMSWILKQFGEHLFLVIYNIFMTKSSFYNSTIWEEFGIKKQLTAIFFRSLNLNVSINLGPADFSYSLFQAPASWQNLSRLHWGFTSYLSYRPVFLEQYV